MTDLNIDDRVSIDDRVMVATGPYALKHGVVKGIPAGLQHPLVQVRFFGANGKLTATKTDLINVNRLCNFGPHQKWLTPRQRAKRESA